MAGNVKEKSRPTVEAICILGVQTNLALSPVEANSTVAVKETLLVSHVEAACTEDLRPSSNLEETCSVFIKEEDLKIELTEIKGNLQIHSL